MTISQALRLESERASADRAQVMPLDDASRIAALEREVAELRASLMEVRRLTLGYRWANTSDSEDSALRRRASYQAGVE